MEIIKEIISQFKDKSPWVFVIAALLIIGALSLLIYSPKRETKTTDLSLGGELEEKPVVDTDTIRNPRPPTQILVDDWDRLNPQTLIEPDTQNGEYHWLLNKFRTTYLAKQYRFCRVWRCKTKPVSAGGSNYIFKCQADVELLHESMRPPLLTGFIVRRLGEYHKIQNIASYIIPQSAATIPVKQFSIEVPTVQRNEIFEIIVYEVADGCNSIKENDDTPCDEFEKLKGVLQPTFIRSFKRSKP